jgi:hypothetical protein
VALSNFAFKIGLVQHRANSIEYIQFLCHCIIAYLATHQGLEFKAIQSHVILVREVGGTEMDSQQYCIVGSGEEK